MQGEPHSIRERVQRMNHRLWWLLVGVVALIGCDDYTCQDTATCVFNDAGAVASATSSASWQSSSIQATSFPLQPGSSTTSALPAPPTSADASSDLASVVPPPATTPTPVLSSGGGTSDGSNVGANSSDSAGTSARTLACDEGAENCLCDANACLVSAGGECLSNSECWSNVCGVTADSRNVCCASPCPDNQVCSADGTACEPAPACDNTEVRCNGDYQVCTDRQWEVREACNGRGCSTTFGGCLLAAGAECTGDGDCGAGTCKLGMGGKEICCTASCGQCQVCGETGASCDVPSLAELGPECECTSQDTSKCDDGLSCTSDSCNNGVCVNDIDSGFCLIGGQCVSHNTPESGNPCRYCDSTLQKSAWTNASTSTSCNDSLWCNGTDTCNGAGTCSHEYPSGNRCSGTSGACALTSCDETRDSCFQPSTQVCSTTTEKQCSSSSCGGAVQQRTITQSCSGSSASCDGTKRNGAWSTTTTCGLAQTCNANTFTCQEALGCGTTFCDATTDQCWTLNIQSGGTLDHADAVSYCNGLTLGGRTDWRLPTIYELIDVARGCNGITSNPGPASQFSTCRIGSDGNPFDCNACPLGQGPTNGCYSPTGFDACTDFAPLSDTVATNGIGGYYYFSFHDSIVGSTPFSGDVFCLVDR